MARRRDFRDVQREIKELLGRSMTAAELAEELDVAVQTVYRWLETQPDVPHFFVSTGPERDTPFFPVPEIFEWFEEHESRRRGPK